MSRHKLVKALGLDEELDEFDGNLDEEFHDGYSAEDKEQLRRGTIEVGQILGPESSITEQQIEESLYYYYYDIPQTVNYLLNKATKAAKTISAKSSGNTKVDHHAMGLRCAELDRRVPAPYSASEFFNDAPWLNIPEDRLARIILEPTYSPVGLLGGAPHQAEGAPKSKLAALAAARKKENRNQVNASSVSSSIALLDRLENKTDQPLSTKPPAAVNRKGTHLITSMTKEGTKKYPVRQSRRPRSPSPRPLPATIIPSCEDEVESAGPRATPAPTASPSTFAETMFGPDWWANTSEPSDLNSIKSQLYSEPAPELLANIEAFAGPSPDDIVLKAQSSSKGAKVLKNHVTKIQGVDTDKVAQDLNNVTITEPTPKIKSKNFDVLGEYTKAEAKNASNFVVIGHVDSGKSTLMGRLLHELRVVDKRTIDKYQKEADRVGKPSFALAFVMDQGTEERERGVTIDIASHKFETDKTIFTILDAPGHRDFIPNMIAGASRADFAILVIDASTGNFESGLKGQTKEHALLVRSMGVQRLIIAVNKIDTTQWSQDRFDEIQQQVSGFLTAAGFQTRNLSFVPCSGLTGDNITRKSIDPLASWYTGAPLLELLESSESITRALEQPLRVTIDDVFRGGVQNPLSVSGRLEAGSTQIGDGVLVMPASQTATIRGIEVDDEQADWAVAGQNVVLHLTEIEAPVPCVKEFAMRILAFTHVMPMHCEVHRGRLQAPGRISKLEALLDKATGGVVKGKKPKLIKPGSVARVTIEMDDAIPLEAGSRVILRADGETIGAGLVQ